MTVFHYVVFAVAIKRAEDIRRFHTDCRLLVFRSCSKAGPKCKYPTARGTSLYLAANFICEIKTKRNHRASHVMSLWHQLDDEHKACLFVPVCVCGTSWLDTLSTADFKWDDVIFMFDNMYKSGFEINYSQTYWQTLYIGPGLLTDATFWSDLLICCIYWARPTDRH
jgi:hypothetical protein